MQEAVQRNDEYKVYCQMAAIFGQANKMEEAEKIYRILVKKFPREKDVWIRSVNFLKSLLIFLPIFFYKKHQTKQKVIR